MEWITSRANERVKSVRALSRAAERRASGRHIAEGEKLVSEAIASGCAVRELYCEEGSSFRERTAVPAETAVFTVSRSVMESMTEAKTPQGVLAVVDTPPLVLPESWPEGLIVLLENVQDPGNVGTVIRTADALGASAVVLTPGTADAFSVKTLRASMGSAYHLPLYSGDAVAAVRRMKEQGFTAVCGHLRGSETLPPHGKKTVLVIGNEGNGVTEALAAECVRFRLKMRGRAESLNASVAAALLIDRLISSEEV